MKTKINIYDTNGRVKGMRPIEFVKAEDGAVRWIEYAGETYYFSRTGTNVRTGKPMKEYAAQGDALRLWVADDFSFAQED